MSSEPAAPARRLIRAHELPAQRLQQAMAMQQLGHQLQRRRLRREALAASEPADATAVDLAMRAWLLHRPGERSDARRLATLRALSSG